MGHPLGFYVQHHRAYPFNAYRAPLGSRAAAPPPRAPHRAVLLYAPERTAPWLGAEHEAAYYEAVAELAAGHWVRWDWRELDGQPPAATTTTTPEPAVFRDFGAYYAALASMRRPRGP